jgi:hypothetical protein
MSLSLSTLHYPSPSLVIGVAVLKELGEGASPYSSPLYKGGLRGGLQGIQRKSNLCVHGRRAKAHTQVRPY